MKSLLLPIALMSFVSATASEPTTAFLPVRAIPDSLDPSRLKVDAASYIFRQVAEGLFAIGEGFQIYPRLAEATEWSADQLKLTIRLRNAKFSDGSPVNASAVIQSLAYCIESAEKTLLVAVRAIDGYDDFALRRSKSLRGIRAKNASEIEIRLSRQAPLLLDDLAQADCHIVKSGPQGSMDLLKGAVGSGPYRVKTANDTEVVLERNPLYYTSVQGPEVGIFRKTSDFGRFDRLKSWASMTTVEYPPEPDPNFSKVEFSELGTHQLIFNNSKAPFDRPDLRRAVALALDYGSLAEKLGWSQDTLQSGLVPLGMAGFRKRDLKGGKAGTSEAIRLLKRHGFDDAHPLKFTILISKLPAYEKEAKLWPDLFGSVPIRVQVELLDHSTRNARLDRGDFQAMRVMKYAGSVEAHRVLSSYLSGSTYNPTRSLEPVCDRFTSEAISTANREARLSLYEKADRCLMDKSILVPLASIQPGYVLLKKPWQLTRANRYLLYPYWISEWRQDGRK